MMKNKTCRMLTYSLVALIALTGTIMIVQGLYIKSKAVVAQILLEEAWDRALAGDTKPKPWPWADVWPVAKISVPKYGKTAVVLNGVSGEAMAFGPGHHTQTPPPGKAGTSVIAAHRDTHFSFLKKLAIGDKISVTDANGNTHSFQVTKLKVVDSEKSGINPDAPGHNLALVTCWPFDSKTEGPMRYIVEAIRLIERQAPQIPPQKDDQHQS